MRDIYLPSSQVAFFRLWGIVRAIESWDKEDVHPETNHDVVALHLGAISNAVSLHRQTVLVLFAPLKRTVVTLFIAA